MPVYAVYCPVEFAMISIYFNSSIDVFRKYHIGYIIGCAGVVVGVLNIVFLQGLYILSSYFLVFEGLFIIGISLFSFFRMLLKDDSLHLYKYVNFWFTTILIAFWSVTFITWALFNYFTYHKHAFLSSLQTLITTIGTLFYFCISLVFLLYPKMETQYE